MEKGSGYLYILPLILSILVASYIFLGNSILNPSLAKTPKTLESPLVSTIPIVTKADETAKWKTFQNSLVNFRYPDNWTVEEVKNNDLNPQVMIKSPTKKVWIKILPQKMLYEFARLSDWETKDIEVIINDKKYQTEESIVNNHSAFVELVITKTNSSSNQVVFGTGYPATSGITPSLKEYHELKPTLLLILSTLHLAAD